MEEVLINIVSGFIFFIKNSWGSLNSPYITYRKLAEGDKKLHQTLFIFLLVCLYFAFASLIRSGLRNPYLLTIRFNSLFFTFLLGFSSIVVYFYLLAIILRTKTTLRQIFLLYSYTLLPTFFWFLLTSLLYLVLPPPRSMSILGKLFSVVFVTLTIALSIWKFILYYLTLRFGLKMDLFKIIVSTIFLIPLLVFYSVSFYRWGVFRIPFL